MGEQEQFLQLYMQCKRGTNNVSFAELCALAEMAGWIYDRQKGSHKIYRHPKHPKNMNFQSVKNKAKPYQVRQLLKFIEDNGLLNGEKK